MARGNGVRPLPHRFSAMVHGHCLLQTRGAVGLSRPPMVPSLDLSILVMQESILRAKEKVLNADLACMQLLLNIFIKHLHARGPVTSLLLFSVRLGSLGSARAPCSCVLHISFLLLPNPWSLLPISCVLRMKNIQLRACRKGICSSLSRVCPAVQLRHSIPWTHFLCCRALCFLEFFVLDPAVKRV